MIRPFQSVCLAFAMLLAGCASGQEVDRAIDRGAAYLAAWQSDDGAWRSGVHGVFRDGTALTPHVLRSLVEVGREAAAVQRARAWLEAVDLDRLAYPTYAATDAAAVSGQSRWIALLRSRQLTDPDTFPSTGGWAYPPGPLSSTVEANTSVTSYAMIALAGSGVVSDDPALIAARQFLLRCRNADGGFLFGPTSEADNKAGAGISYGTTTADAVRGLLAAGTDSTDAAVAGGIQWLLDRFDASQVPGGFLPAREPMRNGNYFYYLDALTDAFTRARIPRHRWAPAVAGELMQRQREDGSWRNHISAGREDDPMVATAFAIRALRRCR